MLSRLFHKKRKFRFYEDIASLPVFYWFEAKKDLRWLIRGVREPLPVVTDEIMRELDSIYEDLHYQVVEEFGISPDMAEMLTLTANVYRYLALWKGHDSGIWKTKYVSTRKRFIRYMDEMEKMKGQTLEEQVAMLEANYLKRDINTKKISVKKWMYYIKHYREILEKQHRHGNH